MQRYKTAVSKWSTPTTWTTMLPTITGSQSQPARHEVVSTLETSATNLMELGATHMICGAICGASADGDLR
jgi:hypothetical protein